MEKKYIDAKEAIDYITSVYDIADTLYASQVVDFLRDFTAADVEEVRRGEWETSRVGAPRIKCSFCKFFIPTTLYLDITKYNYCPHCGAKMDGGEDNA